MLYNLKYTYNILRAHHGLGQEHLGSKLSTISQSAPPAVQASHQAPSIKAVAASDLPPDHTADLPRLLDSFRL